MNVVYREASYELFWLLLLLLRRRKKSIIRTHKISANALQKRQIQTMPAPRNHHMLLVPWPLPSPPSLSLLLLLLHCRWWICCVCFFFYSLCCFTFNVFIFCVLRSSALLFIKRIWIIYFCCLFRALAPVLMYICFSCVSVYGCCCFYFLPYFTRIYFSVFVSDFFFFSFVSCSLFKLLSRAHMIGTL